MRRHVPARRWGRISPSGLYMVSALLCLASVLTATGCSPASAGPGGSAAPAVQKVIVTARSYSAEDLRAAGFKLSREYDVSGLPGATAAVYGFLDKKAYEARFYPSHSDAVAMGSGPAAEVTGPAAVLSSFATSWKEGVRDRMVRSGNQGTAMVAKYGDYVVVGNMVLLCEGMDAGLALAMCHGLISKLPAP